MAAFLVECLAVCFCYVSGEDLIGFSIFPFLNRLRLLFTGLDFLSALPFLKKCLGQSGE